MFTLRFIMLPCCNISQAARHHVNQNVIIYKAIIQVRGKEIIFKEQATFTTKLLCERLKHS